VEEEEDKTKRRRGGAGKEKQCQCFKLYLLKATLTLRENGVAQSI
jgi:hypothetical protein